MQPNFTLKKLGKSLRIAPMLFVLFSLFAGKTNAQCTWTASTVVPIPILDQGIATVGTNLYSFAGVSNGAIVANSYKFDGTTWTSIAAFPVALEFPSAVSDGTNIYIMGGTNGVSQTTNYRYNVATNTYTSLAPFTTGTWNHSAVYLNGKIYKFCGVTAAPTNVLEIYDIASNTWTTGASYPVNLGFVSACAIGNFIYAAGGIDAAGSTKTYRYDPVGNTWSDAAIADLPATRWGSASAVYNGNFIMAGGYAGGDATANISNTVLSWDPVGNTWSTIPNMLGERSRMNGAVLNGSFYVLGGRSIASSAFNGTNNNQKLNCVVLPPCSGTPTPGNTISSVPTVCPAINFDLSLQNATGTGATYQWQSGPSATGPWTNFGTNSSTQTLTQSASTYYRCQVTCGGNTGTSTPVQVLLTPASGCYCTPPASNCTLDDEILNVTFGTLNNSSSGCSGTGYTNYTVSVPAPNAFSGAANPISVTIGPGGADNIGVWIDYNQNGQFEASEFTFLGNVSSGTVNGNINIPSTALNGTTRMRVRVDFSTAMGGGDACTGYTFSETEDYNVNITPCVPVTITAPPASVSITCGSNTSFTVTTAGSGPTFSWQYRVNASGVWQTVPASGIYSGTNTATLVLSNVSQAFNGYQYRALVTGACSAVDFSAPATLTVSAIVPVVTPSSATICLGSIQQLTLTNTLGNSDILNEGFNTVAPLPAGWASQNNSSPVGTTGWFQGNTTVFDAHSGPTDSYIGANFNNTAGTGTISNWLMTPQMTIKNGDIIKFWTRKVAPDAFPDRLEVRLSTAGASTNVGATSTSVGDFTTVLLTVNPTLTTGVYPTTWTQFSATISGLGAPTSGRVAFRYFVTNGGPSGSNSDFIGIDDVVYTSTGGPAQGIWTGPAGTMFTDNLATTAYTGTPATTIYVKPTVTSNYQVSFTTLTPCTSATTTVPVTVVNPVGTVTNPTNKTVCVGGSTTFTASATGGPNTYQWQVSTDGGLTYNNITGATATSYTLSGITQAMNNYRYRLAITAAPCAGTVNSTAAILTVNALPTVTISSPDLSLTPGQTTTITATSSPAAATANSWSWTLDGSSISGTTNTQVVGVDGFGAYQATVTDVNGCVNSSNQLTIGGEASDRLWIYPNPSEGPFQVRLYYAGPVTEKRVVSIFQANGQLMGKKEFDLTNVTSPYLRMDFDLSGLAAGTYVVKVHNTFTNKIVSGLVVIQH